MATRTALRRIHTQPDADAPALAAGDAGVWCVWMTSDRATNAVCCLAPGATSRDITTVYETGHRIESPAVVLDTDDAPWVLWLEEKGKAWQVRAVRLQNGEAMGRPMTLSTGRGALDFTTVRETGGRCWVIWQTMGRRPFRIKARALVRGKWSKAMSLSPRGMSCWRPTAAPCSKGGFWLGWDGESNDGFDIFVRHVGPRGRAGRVHPITRSTAIDTDASLAEGADGRLWIAWHRTPNWGDLSYYRLNVERDIYLRCLDPASGELFVCDSGEDAFGGKVQIPRGKFEDVPLFPQIAVDADGAVRLFYRLIHLTAPRQKVKPWGWGAYHMAREGSAWTPPGRIGKDVGFSTSLVAVAAQGRRLVIAAQECRYLGERRPPTSSGISVLEMERNRETAPARAPHPWQLAAQASHPHIPGAKASLFRVREHSARLKGRTYRLIWGDLHRHTDHSKCVAKEDGSLWDHYRWARTVGALSFYCTADHFEQTSEDEWRFSQRMASRLAADKEFIPISGFEKSVGGRFHVNFFFIDPDVGERVRDCCRQAKDWVSMCCCLTDQGLAGKVLAFPHDHGRGDVPPGSIPEACRPFAPLIEVVQTRGFSPGLAAAALRDGLKVGFIGGSDHASPAWALSWKAVPGWQFPQALTGLWVEDITEDAVWRGLLARRTCATNGVRMAVALTCKGRLMGEEVTIREGDTPRLRILARPTTEISRIQIVRDGAVVHDVTDRELLSGDVDLVFEDPDPPPGPHHVHARIQQDPEPGRAFHGEAWTSPIYITRE